ncbi:MAG TPA: glutamine--fructose-6-phosphate transaminase (isomerizing) [Candidatus Saccharimonadales bacterium]|nr:glutamine--fructose-6-phosphate transaminase (isomerizing) [Candidatus Saccharimonadales bacterium]
MCGIVGYIGSKPSAAIVLAGLQALEYRGYDSAGMALISGEDGTLLKQVGRVEGLQKLASESAAVSAPLAIGHTRWATHGSPTVFNAHPHTNTEETIFVVHNGIIENHAELREELKKHGYIFKSETDTEVIPHLIDFYYKKSKSFELAFKETLGDLHGAYAVAAVTTDHPDTLFAARLSSPLVVGVGEQEYILASDPSAIMMHTKKVMYLEDYDVAVLKQDSYQIHNLKHDKPIERQAELLDYDTEQSRLGDFPHFMLKEIYEAPATIRLASLGRINAQTHTVKLGGLESVSEQLQHIDRIVIVACGTASYAGMLGEYLIEEIAGIPVEVQLGSEFKYRNEPFSRGTALIVVSQSGETADTIAALMKAEKYGVLRLGVVNAVGSTISRMTDAGVYCHAGPEQAVASTKAFIAQVIVLLEIALFLEKGRSPLYGALLKEIEALPAKAEAVLKTADTVQALAVKYKDYKDFLFIGRRYAYPTALEGTLKLKECALVHAEGFAAGEMKHGPLAMIDENFPTIALAGDGPMLEKTVSNIQEIKARKGPVLAIATEGNADIARLVDDVIYIPPTLEQTEPILQAIIMQLFAYHMAVAKGLNVDRPRNLAKSVTVE